MAASRDPLTMSRDPAIRDLQQLLLLCDERGVDPEIKQRLSDAIVLAEERDKYCERVTTRASEILHEIQKETMTYPFDRAFEEGKTKWKLSPGMMSGHFEGKFLQSIISMSRAKKVLEIGMFTGYAALACAEALPEDGTVTTCEFDPFLEEIARGFFDKSPHGKKISIKIGPAAETLLTLSEEKKQFDVIFIDANKDGYTDYFKTIMEKDLLAKGGTIVFDNAFMYGHAYDVRSTNQSGLEIRRCNEYLQTRDDIFRVLVPIRDGMLLVQRKEDVLGQ